MGAAINVGEVYAHLVRDLHAGTYNTPGFDHALHNARLNETVRRAAERGERQKLLEEIESFDQTWTTKDSLPQTENYMTCELTALRWGAPEGQFTWPKNAQFVELASTPCAMGKIRGTKMHEKRM